MSYGFEFVKINEDYLDYLRKFEKRISFTKQEKTKRLFVGILFEINDFLYYAPLTSKKRKENITNFPIMGKDENGNDKCIAMILFNNMIPVYKSNIVKYEINKEKNETYRNYIEDEYNYMLKYKEKILKKAKTTYNGYLRFPESLRQICFDFKDLEKYCIEYNNKKENIIHK